MEYNWPGNVRQLENTIKRLVVMGQCRKISIEMIPPDIRNPQVKDIHIKGEDLNYNRLISDFECEVLREAMRRANNNKSLAAKILNIKPSTFRDKLAKYDE